MQINGKTVHAAGTIILRSGETGTIPSPVGLVPIEFMSDSGATRVQANGGKIEVFNMNNVIGDGHEGTLTINGSTWNFRLTVYTLGQDPQALRTVHFTIY